MAHDMPRAVTGTVTDIFAHRFVVETEGGRVLADLGLHGAALVTLKRGDRVALSGEMKPSELKVHRIAKDGEAPVAIDFDKRPPGESGDPAQARRTAEASGFTVLGEPRRKPRHFEVLGRDHAGDLVELHVEFDGRLRKTKPVDPGEGKWSAVTP